MRMHFDTPKLFERHYPVAFGWALQRLAGYALAALAGVVVFVLWATFYTFVWPGIPARQLDDPTPQIQAPADQRPATQPLQHEPSRAEPSNSPLMARSSVDSMAIQVGETMQAIRPQY